MTVKEWYDFFNSVRAYDHKIRRLIYTLAELRYCVLPSGGNDNPTVQHSRNGSQIEKVMERIVLLEEELEGVKQKKADAIMKIDETLRTMPEGAEKTILYDFYIGRIPMKKISDNVGYSIKHCYKLRKRAVERMADDDTINNNPNL